jgi:hypothetical protein
MAGELADERAIFGEELLPSNSAWVDDLVCGPLEAIE